MASKGRQLLFSVTRKDLKIETFRVSGAGGQKRDKVENGVRITHSDSGASAKATESRSQAQNRKIAFRRLMEDPRFKLWHRIETARRLGVAEQVDEAVEKAMAERHLRIEMKENGKWVEEKR